VETVRGQVLPLADLLKPAGVELDPEAAPHCLALRGDDGRAYPLLRDAGSRPFARDARLLRRPVELQVRQVAGLWQVLQVLTLKDGKPHEVFYWCDVCAIRRPSLEKVCECCGGPMELREVPVKK
jgi:hypothetical protein